MQSKFLVVGTGRAGQSRLKSLQTKDGVEPISLSARDPQFSSRYDQHLADESVTAVLICTGNDSHYALARSALSAAKHTLVEFPLCRTHQEGQALYDIANRNGCVLHVEFVGLMTGGHRALCAVPTDDIAQIRVEMSGGYYRWVKSDAESGHLGSLLVGRLQALHQLVGPLDLVDVQCSQSSLGYNLRVSLEGRGGVKIELIDERATECKRRRSMEVFNHQHERIAPDPLPSTMGLFDADLDLFMSRIRDGSATSVLVEDADVLAIMALADRISEQCRMTSRMLKP